MLKLSDNPPMSWPIDLSIEDSPQQWWAAHTKSRNEKAIAKELAEKNIIYFLPMIMNYLKYGKKKVKTLLPLFPGYIFFSGGEQERLNVLKTNRVATIIEVKDQKKLRSELTQIQRALNSGADIKPHKYIKEGQRCTVTSGPLENTEGIVLKTKDGTRLVLSIDILGQAVSVEIDSGIIETIE